ncbi:MAG: hypothetical protein B7Y25_06790 [Alphaproteobacteria bacterium 16-39-46]|nr:MAG: hypothetical protein B7Y25_06790 [Alphaproteobacteria bacterium 16-39-46]OZA42065.1 MAG: hypothetical protein B7X84_06955 [Alphaproteobacteria bacterium 17-39-52]HQS84597.1 DUF167 domain-containing protein [Alphaproteobacteria bacterium]HQS94423.1 DUF167 domain-containing protein [Alphaproteobacteria bacterium]
MTASFSSLFKKTTKGVTLRLKVSPRSRVSKITAIQDDEAPSTLDLFQEKILKVSLKEPPEKGRANAALLKLLSRTWKIPKTDLHLLTGETSSLKVLLIKGDPEDLQKTLEKWLAETSL